MAQPQRIVLERRAYNQWVANQTLEDYALRFTATKARQGSFRIANTALGAISFLACEAIGGSITLTYGFSNVAAAIMAVGVLSFLLGLPIAFHAARAGVDVDLLTRGAGFGYLGSTITSLIYASFTFVLFAIEASIMSMALKMVFGIPLPIAHIISSMVVIPIAAYGIRYISRMQLATQPIWLVLQIAPLAYIALRGGSHLGDWTHFTGALGAARTAPSACRYSVPRPPSCSRCCPRFASRWTICASCRCAPPKTGAAGGGRWFQPAPAGWAWAASSSSPDRFSPISRSGRAWTANARPSRPNFIISPFWSCFIPPLWRWR